LIQCIIWFIYCA